AVHGGTGHLPGGRVGVGLVVHLQRVGAGPAVDGQPAADLVEVVVDGAGSDDVGLAAAGNGGVHARADDVDVIGQLPGLDRRAGSLRVAVVDLGRRQPADPPVLAVALRGEGVEGHAAAGGVGRVVHRDVGKSQRVGDGDRAADGLGVALVAD